MTENPETGQFHESVHLFQPMTVRSITLRNRVMVSPMCQYSAHSGHATEWHLVHLGGFALGGAGTVMLETTAVQEGGRISHWDLGIWDDAHVPELQRIAGFLKDHGSVPAIQIGHAGRKASQKRPWEGGGPLDSDGEPWETVAPSAIPFDEGWSVPCEMSIDDIHNLIDSFRDAARRADECGFDILEVHAAHGYLLNQFLSHYSNHREDEYGGSPEARMRLTLEVIEAVRAVWPGHKPLSVRISATDWTSGGWGIDDSVVLCNGLKERGVDLIDVSSGGIVPTPAIAHKPGYQVWFAEEIRRRSAIPTIAVGLITDACQAERILNQGNADIIALGRELLRHPHWPLDAARSLGAEIAWQSQYERAKL